MKIFRVVFVSLFLICLLTLTVGSSLAQEPRTIAEIVLDAASGATPEFTTLLAALQRANLVDTLNGPGTFTVFAPTDAAFAALPEGVLDTLLAEEPPTQLTNILLYHVLGEVKFGADLAGLTSVTTLIGEQVHIGQDKEGNLILNGSVKVIVADIEASNGVVHVIDAVLLPGEKPSAVHLTMFDVSVKDGLVTMVWETVTELDNAGFNIYRTASPGGPYIKINSNLIPAQGDELFGGYYTFFDRPGRGTFYYQLEDVNLFGESSLHESVLAQTGPAIRGPVFRPNIPE